MNKLILYVFCTGFITTTIMAKDTHNSTPQASNYMQDTATYAKPINNEVSFYSLLQTGLNYQRHGQLKEALSSLHLAEKKTDAASDLVIVYELLGEIYNSLGDPKNDLAYNTKFLDMALIMQDRKVIGNAYNNLGRYFREQNQPQKALEYFNKARNQYMSDKECGHIYGNMALAYADLTDIRKAEEMHNRAIAIDQKNYDNYNLRLHKSNLGIFYYNQGRNDEARSTLEDALRMSLQVGDILKASYALSFLADIDYKEGQFSKASERAAEALRLAQKNGNPAAIKKANDTLQQVNRK